jgi:hypothetical protein
MVNIILAQGFIVNRVGELIEAVGCMVVNKEKMALNAAIIVV